MYLLLAFLLFVMSFILLHFLWCCCFVLSLLLPVYTCLCIYLFINLFSLHPECIIKMMNKPLKNSQLQGKKPCGAMMASEENALNDFLHLVRSLLFQIPWGQSSSTYTHSHTHTHAQSQSVSQYFCMKSDWKDKRHELKKPDRDKDEGRLCEVVRVFWKLKR